MYKINRIKLFLSKLSETLHIKYLIFCIIIIVSTNVSAQDKGSIKGKITDKSTGEELIGTNVFLDGTGFGAAADIEGNYKILNIPSGTYKLKISYIGYEEQQIDVNIVGGKTLSMDIELLYSGSTELDEVTITAQARGQMNAINEQLNSKSITNVISAERMQELPDANAAETIGRLPGVSVLRSGGEGNKVVIRGLSPKYNKVMLEGISMAATGSDRSSDISMISPYSLDGIEVMKAVTADHDADFIGGAVNFKLRTADPGFKYDIVAQGGYNDLKSTYSDFMLVGSVSNRFFDDKLGIYLQGNIEQRNRSSNDLLASYDVRNDAEVGIDNPVYTQNFTLSDVIRERKRYGATLVLDYTIPDGIIKSKNLFSQSGTNINRYNQIYGVVNRNHSFIGSQEQYDLGVFSNILDYEQRFDKLKVDAKIAHSYSNNEMPTNLSYSFNQIGAIETEALNASISPFEILKFANLNDSLATFNSISENSSLTEERQIESALNVQYDFTISNQVNGFIKIGSKVRFKDRSYDQTAFGSDLFIANGRANGPILDANPWMRDKLGLNDDQVSRLPYYLFSDQSFDHKNYLDGEYSMGAVPNLEFLQNVLNSLKDAYRIGGDEFKTDSYRPFERSSKTFDYSGNEHYYAGYAMAELNIGKSIKFIPGVRYEKNITEYTGVRGITNVSGKETNFINHDTTFTRTNEFFLPMIHLKYSPLDWFDARFAYTQTLSRPSYFQIMPRMDTWGNTVSFNNYKLEPEFSENFDLYLTFKENHVGLFTIGGFTKKIDNMIFNLGRRVIIDTTIYDLSSEYFGRDIYTTANNKSQATVWGIEIDLQTNFWYLPGALKGIVLNINYTHIFSEAEYPFTKVENHAVNPWDKPIWVNIDSFYTSQLVNQPDDIINVQIGYDYEDFSARLSMLYQSRIFKNANFWPELSNYADEYLRWDFSVKQKLPWYGIQVFCNINNITAARDRDLVNGANWDAKIQDYGMTVDFGLRTKL